jgi:hypothetical protein
MSMRTCWRLGPTCLWLASVLLSGCAERTELPNVPSRPGEIRGRVEILTGAVPAAASVAESSFEAREIMVFLEPTTAQSSLEHRQQDRVLAIQTGQDSPEIQLVTIDQPFRIENLDSIHHELFTASSENSLRIRLKGRSQSEILSLASPSLVRLYCALHPDENHTLVVSAGHEHAFVDSDSRFRIPHVRPGRYRVRAASTDAWSQPQTVNVGAAETVELTLRLAPDRNQ